MKGFSTNIVLGAVTNLFYFVVSFIGKSDSLSRSQTYPLGTKDYLLLYQDHNIPAVNFSPLDWLNCAGEKSHRPLDLKDLRTYFILTKHENLRRFTRSSLSLDYLFLPVTQWSYNFMNSWTLPTLCSHVLANTWCHCTRSDRKIWVAWDFK